MKPLEGKTALVTGAAGTMGLAATKFLLEDGARVVMVDLSEARMRDATRGLRGEIEFIEIDISDAAEVLAAHARVAQKVGPLDILVNNAGILSNNKVEATSDEEWRRVLGVNLDGAFHWSRAVLPAMKTRKWGRIINVSSLAAKTGGLTAGTAYSVSKGAMSALTFSLARESAAFGVTVNAISPAYVKTPMVTEGLSEAQRVALLVTIPVGRFCEPEEFAHVVRFLASPLAGFITGEVIDINGGLLMD
ncbi:MAG: SDR family oxidoreductase [Burkholderiales bacterium]|nr:SDR family oxidoreductase [Burkholderiales bacterium]